MMLKVCTEKPKHKVTWVKKKKLNQLVVHASIKTIYYFTQINVRNNNVIKPNLIFVTIFINF